MALLSLVIPTYNEAKNIGPLLAQLAETFAGQDIEYVIVDDNSPDGTADAARAANPDARVIVRTDEKGLATAVTRGFAEATGTYVAVMDADFQHPPDAMQALLDRAVETDADLVIGSRYVPGGAEKVFNPFRRLVSRGAALIAQVMLPPVRKHGLTDPMSGLFLVKRTSIDPAILKPSGYKILLEILGRHELERVEEVGYKFQSRREGASKLGGGVMLQYLLHVMGLAWIHPENRRILHFGLVGLTGVVVNLGVLFVLKGLLGLYDLIAVAIAVELSILSNFFLNDRFTFHDRRRGHRMQRLAQFNAVSLLALAVNLSTYTALTRLLDWHYLLAEAVAIVVAFGANYIGNLQWTYGGVSRFQLRQTLRGWAPWLPFWLIVAGAAWSFSVNLDHPDEIYFDEHYYVSVAAQSNNGIWEDPCWIGDQELDHRPLNYEHPPLAKLIIAWSMDKWGTYDGVFEGCRSPDGSAYREFTDGLRDEGNPYSWRIPSAVFGTITVAFIGLAAGRLFGGPVPAVLGASFVALDTLILGASRLAILDIFAVGFLAMAIYAAADPKGKGFLAAALWLSLGFACKYTVAFAGPAVFLLAWITARRVRPIDRQIWLAWLAVFAVMPMFILAITYIPWWRIWIPEMGVIGALLHWKDVLAGAVFWGATAQQTHPYISSPGDWLLMQKPMLWYSASGYGGDPNKVAYIYAIGNPIIWWGGALAALAPFARPAWLTVRPGGKKGDLSLWWNDIGAHGQAWIMAATLTLSTYAAFFLLQRQTFIFYMVAVIPLLALSLTGAVMQFWRRGGWWQTAPVAILAAAFWFYMLYRPIIMAEVIQRGALEDILGVLPWLKP